MLKRKLITLILTLSIITPFFYLPYQARRAEAVFGIGDIVIDIKAMAERMVDGFAMVMAQKLIDSMVQSTIKWAQTGFEGNPAYVTEPEQYFTDITDGVVGQFIAGSDLGYLCSPFQANVRLSLVQQYYEPQQFQCTLTDVVANIDAFYEDFNQGGWDAWFSMTQNSSNNPYGAYLQAKIELDSRIASAVGLKNDELDRNQGFLSWSECTKKNPQMFLPGAAAGPGLPALIPNPEHVAGKAVGECIERGPVKTPGTTIKSQLDRVLPSGLEKLVNAQHIDQLVSAFATGLLQRYVFGPKGLFNSDNTGDAAPGGTQDIDGDGIADGLDTTGDGQLDVCYFGGTDSIMGPPCLSSSREVEDSVNGGREGSGGVTTGGGGGQCSVSGQQYEEILRDAMNTVLANNPDVANLPNIESGGRQNARTFLALVETELISMGYEAADDVLNGNNNANTGDLIAVWRSGDTMMERYDAIIGAAPTIALAATADFTGFIPLNCTPAGGGRDCGCQSNAPGGGNTPGTPGTGTPGSPAISGVSPASVNRGQTLVVNGANLTTTVQFFDASANRSTVVGILNANATEVRAVVPNELPNGLATVRVYKDANTFSNTLSIQITGGSSIPGGGTIPTVAPISTWTPTHTVNGWWPVVSPNGRYVTYGNWGESWVTDLETNTNYDFATPADLAGKDHRCIAGHWITDTKLTFVCESPTEFPDNGIGGGFARYEVTAGEWIARRTSDLPNNVWSNQFVARDGHWAAFLAGASRLVKDNQVLVSNGSGGVLTLSGNTLAHSCNNQNSSICVREGSTLSRTYIPKTPLHGMNIHSGYILYGGLGPVRGITPFGSDLDLTVAPWRWEAVGDMVMVNGVMWVATTGWDEANAKGYIFIRPWGSLSTIAISAEATNVSIEHKNGNFIIAYNNDTGGMAVLTVPVNSPRSTLR